MPCTSRTIGTSGLPSGCPATPTCRTPPATGTARPVWNGEAMRVLIAHSQSRCRCVRYQYSKAQPGTPAGQSMLRTPLDDGAAHRLRGGRARQLEVLDGEVGD